MLARMQSPSWRGQTLIVVPTIELALTVGTGIEKMSAYLPNIPMLYVTSSLPNTETLANTSLIIVHIDMLDSLRSSSIDFSRLAMLIIDEIDTFIIREDHRERLLDLIDSLSSVNDCQILVYSSTSSEQIMNFTNELIPDAVVVKQRADKQRLSNVEQFYLICQDEYQKLKIIDMILTHFVHGKMMIFCADDDRTERVRQRLILPHKHE